MAAYGISLKTNGVWKCEISVPGTLYDDEFDVSFTGGGGTGARGYAIAVGGQIQSIVVTRCGSGYTSAPTVDLSAGGGTLGAATSILETGFLLRYGFCDFTESSDWDAINNEQHEVITGNIFCFTDPFNPDSVNITKWDGEQWVLIARN